jgi:hypothetical protein
LRRPIARSPPATGRKDSAAVKVAYLRNEYIKMKAELHEEKTSQDNHKPYVGFEVLKAVVMKSPIFWDIMACIPLKVKRRFGGTYCLFTTINPATKI